MHERDTGAAVPEPEAPVESISPAALRERIDRGDPVTVLDVRTTSDFEEWHLEGESVTVENRPYYEFLEAPGLPEDLPRGDPLVVVCAEGDASDYVAGELRSAGRDAVTLDGGMAGWARIYDRNEIAGYDGPGVLYQYHRPSTGCLSYLLVDGGEAAVVDPLRAFRDQYVEDAAALGADLVYAIDTHCHADHVSGVTALAKEGVTGVVPEPTTQRGMEADVDLLRIEDGDELIVGAATIETRHTPGHTSGMSSYLVGESVVLTGDSLFVDSVARPDLEAGDEGAPEAARQLYRSLQERILSLDPDVIVAGGHTAPSDSPGSDGTFTARLGALVDRMAVLSKSEDEFVEHVLADMPPRPANFEQIIAANLGKQSVDDEEAFRIELGPNNCAAGHGTSTG
ncbi:MBL fold metallo-hydrolase [Halodesulfurarchaeum sp. HSR-GB]|uniref:MBL fold metallo-hydrolase n=1 Tax=Halodesulfurarchaeum sp. HSR-GB TaxID=3074077 RepID=UPI00285F0931|nr:MBL fold metallo-hydrolase [Halodesulfurarchaeum sp. HSR-GB]MDR5655804.1 MBL fold metallo-hydrolase [Halodesulfurarchaeum sp. HSR-GB]